MCRDAHISRGDVEHVMVALCLVVGLVGLVGTMTSTSWKSVLEENAQRFAKVLLLVPEREPVPIDVGEAAKL